MPPHLALVGQQHAVTGGQVLAVGVQHDGQAKQQAVGEAVLLNHCRAAGGQGGEREQWGKDWEQLVLAAGIPGDTRWAALSRAGRHALVEQLQRTELPVMGKSLNQDEFVTCGGVRLGEVNFKTMESRLCPGLYFAGELLDMDGLTGGFNFQAAWTTGWLAGQALAQ